MMLVVREKELSLLADVRNGEHVMPCIRHWLLMEQELRNRQLSCKLAF